MKIFWEVLLIVGCVAVVLGVILSRVIAHKKGKGGCDCGCSDCSACQYCRQIKRKENK